jgi:hypothetical protein
MEIDEDALYNQLKEQPDFDCLPIPATWFAKYNIPARTTPTTKDFLESGYTLMRATEQKDLPPIIHDEPQQNGKLVESQPFEEIKVDVVSRAFEWDSSKPFPATLPMLKELPIPEEDKPKTPF